MKKCTEREVTIFTVFPTTKSSTLIFPIVRFVCGITIAVLLSIFSNSVVSMFDILYHAEHECIIWDVYLIPAVKLYNCTRN